MRREESTTPTLRPSFKKVQAQFEAWRSTRKHREPVPDALWEATAGLRRDHSIHQVAKALHRNHTDLKKRVEKEDIVSASRSHPLLPVLNWILADPYCRQNVLWK